MTVEERTDVLLNALGRAARISVGPKPYGHNCTVTLDLNVPLDHVPKIMVALGMLMGEPGPGEQP
jgi:hypothetical protein